MCGRVRISSDVNEIKIVFSVPPDRPTPNAAPSWNVAPTDPLSILLYDAKGGERSMMPAWRCPKRLFCAYFFLIAALTAPHPAFAWGDEGHEIIALIAEHYLDPAVRAKIANLLAVDTTL